MTANSLITRLNIDNIVIVKQIKTVKIYSDLYKLDLMLFVIQVLSSIVNICIYSKTESF